MDAPFKMQRPRFNEMNPFRLGVASGCPTEQSVVLWTRLAPDPLRGGQMGTTNDLPVNLVVARDFQFNDVVVNTTVYAMARYAHSVHSVVDGLDPDTEYWYRFKYNGYTSPIGRTKTAGAREHLYFAFVNCQNLQEGRYPVYREIANDPDLDLVIHLGDYIYESAPAGGGPRRHQTKAPVDLESFRNRHADYKMDPDLQAAHAAHPWLVTWDDHEVENDYAGTHSWYNQAAFPNLRRAAYQAYYEHMPLPPSAIALPELKIYRESKYGDLAKFLVMDVRQYRTKQPCGDYLGDCAERHDPVNDMLGPEQEEWLLDHLSTDGPQWNILVNSIFMLEYDHPGYYPDGWDGYIHSRKRIFQHLYDYNVPNPVVLSGDIHAAWVADLKYHPEDPLNAFKRSDSINIATEFVGPSVTSTLSQSWTDTYRKALPRNPHVKYFDERPGGYVRCVVTHEKMTAEYRLTTDMRLRTSPLFLAAKFTVDTISDGGVQPAEDLVDVQLVEPEPDYRLTGWRWAEGYGEGDRSWLLPRKLKLSTGETIDFEQLKRG